jgi:uncharacterized protein (TIGR02391 family)
MLDFHLLRHRAKKALLGYWQAIDITVDPLAWAWIARALSMEGIAGNPYVAKAIELSSRWLTSAEAWGSDAHLGSIGILCSLHRLAQTQKATPATEQLTAQLERLREKGLGKFSRLNDPDIVYGLSLGVGQLVSHERDGWLLRHVEGSSRPGNWRRRFLFAASAAELGADVAPFLIHAHELQIHELIPAIWFCERYPRFVENSDGLRDIWLAFERAVDGISLEILDDTAGSMFAASPVDVAMLFEALVAASQSTDPVVLFNNIPWHEGISRASEGLFIKGEYVMAVFQAGLVFIDAVKRKAGGPLGRDGRPLDGADLMKHVFGSKSPTLRFTEMKTQAEENEHRGLALIAEGIASAIRNPKGHTPKDAIPLGPYEALEQLAIVSYLLRRLDASRPSSQP